MTTPDDSQPQARKGRWAGVELRADWLARQTPPPCQCGCGAVIPLRLDHRRTGFPKYLNGHHPRHSRIEAEDFLAQHSGQHICECGCGGVVVIKPSHRYSGIPRFIYRHQRPRPLGFGPAHPNYRVDRTTMRSRDAHAFGVLARRQIFERCGGRCVSCGATEPLEYDHIVPRSAGGAGDPENGQLLCANCHRKKTTVDPPGAGRKRRKKSP